MPGTKNMLRFWREQAPFLGKTSSGFWDKLVRFGGKLVRFGPGGKLDRFLDWLGTKLKSRCFER